MFIPASSKCEGWHARAVPHSTVNLKSDSNQAGSPFLNKEQCMTYWNYWKHVPKMSSPSRQPDPNWKQYQVISSTLAFPPSTFATWDLFKAKILRWHLKSLDIARKDHSSRVGLNQNLGNVKPNISNWQIDPRFKQKGVYIQVVQNSLQDHVTPTTRINSPS